MNDIVGLFDAAKTAIDLADEIFPTSLVIRTTASGVPFETIIPNKKFKCYIYYDISVIYLLCSDYYVINSKEFNAFKATIRTCFYGEKVEFRYDVRLPSSMYPPLLNQRKISLGLKKLTLEEIWGTNHQNIRKIYMTKQLLQAQIR